MNEIPREDELRNIVREGLKHLRNRLAYQQTQVLEKLDVLEHPINPASLTNIKKNKPVGLPTLNKAAIGMEMLLQQELDMKFDTKAQDFQPQHTSGWVATIVPEKSPQKAIGPGFIMHAEGRLPLDKKTAFIEHAEQDVIEIGVRLNAFSGYFIHQNENAYKTHIMSLLQKGVHIKGYLVDPECNEARIYFEDRIRKQSLDKDAIRDIKKVIDRLKELCKEFEEKQWPGKFEIYLYKHIPYSMFLVVDGMKDSAKMMVSPYLYGVTRANCPVLEFTKKSQPLLFRKYWDSMQAFLSDAKKLT